MLFQGILQNSFEIQHPSNCKGIKTKEWREKTHKIDSHIDKVLEWHGFFSVSAAAAAVVVVVVVHTQLQKSTYEKKKVRWMRKRSPQIMLPKKADNTQINLNMYSNERVKTYNTIYIYVFRL